MHLSNSPTPTLDKSSPRFLPGFTGWRRGRILFTRLILGVSLVLLLACGNRMARYGQVDFLMSVIGLFLVALGVWGRIWCTLYIGGRKDQVLVTEGPYARCRNPLYFFSALAGVGVAGASGSVVVVGLVMVFFAVGYHFVIRAEERKLLLLHGESFVKYCREVPRFWMSLGLPSSGVTEQRAFTSKLFHRTSRDAAWFFVAWSAVLWVKVLHQTGTLPTWWNLP